MAELVAIRERARSSSAGAADAAAAGRVLDALRSLAVDASLLRATGIGVELNRAEWKRHVLALRKRTSLLVSLLSGALAGLVATCVSQPSDAILTKLATSPGLGIGGAAAALWEQGGLPIFFAGFVTRSVWAAAIIAGQFLLYDIAKQLFRVTAKDLTQTADVLKTALRTRTRSSLEGVQPQTTGA